MPAGQSTWAPIAHLTPQTSPPSAILDHIARDLQLFACLADILLTLPTPPGTDPLAALCPLKAHKAWSTPQAQPWSLVSSGAC